MRYDSIRTVAGSNVTGCTTLTNNELITRGFMGDKDVLQGHIHTGTSVRRARAIRPCKHEPRLCQRYANRQLRGSCACDGRRGVGDDIQVNAGIERGRGVADIPAGKDRLPPGVTVQGDLVYYCEWGHGATVVERDE